MAFYFLIYRAINLYIFQALMQRCLFLFLNCEFIGHNVKKTQKTDIVSPINYQFSDNITGRSKFQKTSDLANLMSILLTYSQYYVMYLKYI